MGIQKLKYNMQVDTHKQKKHTDKRNTREEELYDRNQAHRLDQKKRRMVTTSIVSIATMITMAIIILSRFNAIYAVQGEISNFKGEIRTFSESNEDLNIKISESVSLEKLEKIAREKLNMVYPSREDAINIVP